MEESTRLRQALVDQLIAAGQLRSPAVTEAFTSVPRELFVPEIARAKGLAHVYSDVALVTHERDGVPTSSSSQPAVMALMLDALGVEPGDNVLEVGLGTGFNAALLSRLAGPQGRVTSVDIDEHLVEKATRTFRGNGFAVTAALADGRGGWPAGAPYDRMILTASADAVPRVWWEQLAPGGVLVLPLRLDALQIIVAFERTGDGFRSRRLIPGGFMPLRDPADGKALPESDSNGTVVVRTLLPGQGTQTVQATGPALATLAPQAVQRLIGNLVLDPVRAEVSAPDGTAVLWHTALTAEVSRQITAFLDFAGMRFGLADLESGAFSTLVVQRVAGRFELVGIDTFGPDPTGAGELLDHVRAWRERGSPSLEQLAISVFYTGQENAALRTVTHPDHRICFTWN